MLLRTIAKIIRPRRRKLLTRILKVYLAGPITGCSYQGCTDWRQYVIDQVGAEFVCLSPMRAKPYLEGVDVIGKEYEGDNPLKIAISGPKAIMTRDHWDCTTADVIFANLEDAEIISVGTMFEFAWAFTHQVPLIAVMPPGNLHEHPMVTEAISFRLPSVDDGITVLRSLP